MDALYYMLLVLWFLQLYFFRFRWRVFKSIFSFRLIFRTFLVFLLEHRNRGFICCRYAFRQFLRILNPANPVRCIQRWIESNLVKFKYCFIAMLCNYLCHSRVIKIAFDSVFDLVDKVDKLMLLVHCFLLDSDSLSQTDHKL